MSITTHIIDIQTKGVQDLEKIAKALEKGSKAARDSSGRFRKLSKAERELNTVSRKTAQALRTLAPSLKVVATGLAQAEKSAIKMRAALARSDQEVLKLKASVKALQKNYDMLSASTARAGAKTQKTTQEMKKAQIAMAGMARSMGVVTMSYASLVPLMAGMAMGKAVQKVYALGAAFEYTTTYIDALNSNLNSFDASGIQKSLLSLEGLRKGPSELAAGMKEFAKAGVEAANAIGQIAEISKFATLAELELGAAVKLVVGQSKAFGIDYADSVNMIGAAALSSATSIEEMGTALSYTTELASVTGTTFDEVATAMAIMANAGIRGSKAGTALRTSILKMATPTEGLKKKLDALGISWSVFSEGGKIKDLKTMFTELARATEKLPDEQRVGILKDLFGLRAMKGGANILRSMGKEWDELNQKVKESTEGVTFLSTTYDKMADTTTAKWEELGVAVEKSLLQAFDSEGVKGAIESMTTMVSSDTFIDSLTSVVDALNEIGTALMGLMSLAGALPGDLVDSGVIGYILMGKSALGRVAGVGFLIDKWSKELQQAANLEDGSEDKGNVAQAISDTQSFQASLIESWEKYFIKRKMLQEDFWWGGATEQKMAADIEEAYITPRETSRLKDTGIPELKSEAHLYKTKFESLRDLTEEGMWAAEMTSAMNAGLDAVVLQLVDAKREFEEAIFKELVEGAFGGFDMSGDDFFGVDQFTEDVAQVSEAVTLFGQEYKTVFSKNYAGDLDLGTYVVSESFDKLYASIRKLDLEAMDPHAKKLAEVGDWYNKVRQSMGLIWASTEQEKEALTTLNAIRDQKIAGIEGESESYIQLIPILARAGEEYAKVIEIYREQNELAKTGAFDGISDAWGPQIDKDAEAALARSKATLKEYEETLRGVREDSEDIEFQLTLVGLSDFQTELAEAERSAKQAAIKIGEFDWTSGTITSETINENLALHKRLIKAHYDEAEAIEIKAKALAEAEERASAYADVMEEHNKVLADNEYEKSIQGLTAIQKLYKANERAAREAGAVAKAAGEDEAKTYSTVLAGLNAKIELNGDVTAAIKEQRDEIERLIEEEIRLAKESGSVWDGFIAGAKEAQREAQTLGELGAEIFESFHAGVKDSFVAIFKGEFDQIGEIWENTLDKMLDSVIDWAAEAATNFVIDAGIDLVNKATGGLLSELGIFGEGPTGNPGDPIYVVIAGGCAEMGEGSSGVGEILGTLGGIIDMGYRWANQTSALEDMFGALADQNYDAYGDMVDQYSSVMDEFYGTTGVEGTLGNSGKLWGQVGEILSEEVAKSITDDLNKLMDDRNDLFGFRDNTLTEDIKNAYQKAAPYLGMAAGAYGMYSGYQQMGQGNYVGGGISMAGGAANIYNSGSQAGIWSGQYAGMASNVTGLVGGLYGMYSGISDMLENGVTPSNAVGTGVSAYSTYTAGTALYAALTETSIVISDAAALIAAEKAVTAGSQAAGIGLGAYAGPVAIVAMMVSDMIKSNAHQWNYAEDYWTGRFDADTHAQLGVGVNEMTVLSDWQKNQIFPEVSGQQAGENVIALMVDALSAFRIDTHDQIVSGLSVESSGIVTQFTAAMDTAGVWHNWDEATQKLNDVSLDLEKAMLGIGHDVVKGGWEGTDFGGGAGRSAMDDFYTDYLGLNDVLIDLGIAADGTAESLSALEAQQQGYNRELLEAAEAKWEEQFGGTDPGLPNDPSINPFTNRLQSEYGEELAAEALESLEAFEDNLRQQYEDFGIGELYDEMVASGGLDKVKEQLGIVSESLEDVGRSAGQADAILNYTGEDIVGYAEAMGVGFEQLTAILNGVEGAASGAANDLKNLDGVLNSGLTGTYIIPDNTQDKMLKYGGVVGYAGGGILEGGSGERDDIYLGTVNGRHQMAMGGEFIMPQDQTQKYLPILRQMQTDNYALGGTTLPYPEPYNVPDLGFTSGEVDDHYRYVYKDELKELLDDLADISKYAEMTDFELAQEKLKDNYRDIIAEMQKYQATQEEMDSAKVAYEKEYKKLMAEQAAALHDFMIPFNQFMEGTSELDISLQKLQKQYTDYIRQAEEMGATEEQLATIRDAHAKAASELVTANSQALIDLLKPYEQLASGMSDAEVWLQSLSDTYADTIERAKELGATEEQLNRIREAQTQEIQNRIDDVMEYVNDTIDKDALSDTEYAVKGITDKFDDMRDTLLALGASEEDLIALEKARQIELENAKGTSALDYYDDLLAMGASVSTFGSQSVPGGASSAPVNNVSVEVVVDGNGIINDGALESRIVDVSDKLVYEKGRRAYTGQTVYPGVQ